jgi:DNA-directed RNA polymerase subunit H (RpoH/RPB5)
MVFNFFKKQSNLGVENDEVKILFERLTIALEQIATFYQDQSSDQKNIRRNFVVRFFSWLFFRSKHKQVRPSHLSLDNDEVKILFKRFAVALEQIASSYQGEASEQKQIVEALSNFLPIKEVESGKDDDLVPDNVLMKFLELRNIQVKTMPTVDAADDIINSLAEFLGKNYDALRDILAQIKRNMQFGGAFSLSIKKYSQKNISSICQFCTRLHEVAFLEQYKYFKAPQYIIRAKTTALPKAQNFFSGIWLERFVLLSVQKVVNLVSNELNQKLQFSYLLNPQIILPNGDDFELDLLFHINDCFYWIEAKSGNYQQHISKYSKISKILKLDYEHSIMVLTDISSEKSSALTSLFSMNVYSLSQLESCLIQTIKKDQALG